MKSKKIESLQKKLIELESLMGSFSMKLLLKRVLYEMGKGDIEVPESVQSFPLENFSQKELDQFVQRLTAAINSIVGEDFGKEIEKIWSA